MSHIGEVIEEIEIIPLEVPTEVPQEAPEPQQPEVEQPVLVPTGPAERR